MKCIEIEKLICDLCDICRIKKLRRFCTINSTFLRKNYTFIHCHLSPNFEVQSTTYLGSRWGNPNFVLVSGVIYVLITTRRSIYRFYIRGSLRWGSKWAGHGTAAWEICRRKSDFQKVSWCGFESIYYTAMSSQVWPLDPCARSRHGVAPRAKPKTFRDPQSTLLLKKTKRGVSCC